MGTEISPRIDPESPFRVGPWLVDPRKNFIAADGQRVRLEPKAMRVLVLLASRRGEDVPRAAIVDAVWGSTLLRGDVLSNTIWELRKALGDDPREPDFIQTVPRKGYRLVASVAAGWDDDRSFVRWRKVLLLGLVFVVAFLLGLWAAHLAHGDRPSEPGARSTTQVP